MEVKNTSIFISFVLILICCGFGWWLFWGFCGFFNCSELSQYSC